MISYGAPAHIRRILNTIFPFNADAQGFFKFVWHVYISELCSPRTSVF